MAERNLVGLVYNPRIAEAAALCDTLANLRKLQERYWVASSSELDEGDDKLENTSAIITAGGDGTILRAVRVAAPHSVPILGINLGRVGFMTELAADEAVEKIPAYLNGSPRVEERTMLRASVRSRSNEEVRVQVHALNDVVVSRGAVPRLLDVDIAIDGVPLTTYRSDGAIVATATGSTGYALSAGGPVLFPEARVMLIQPIAAHMGLQSGLIVPEDSVIELRVSGGNEAVLSVDGFTDTKLGPDDNVVIERSPYAARFLRSEPSGAFYATVTERLGVRSRPAPEAPDL